MLQLLEAEESKSERWTCRAYRYSFPSILVASAGTDVNKWDTSEDELKWLSVPGNGRRLPRKKKFLQRFGKSIQTYQDLPRISWQDLAIIIRSYEDLTRF